MPSKGPLEEWKLSLANLKQICLLPGYRACLYTWVTVICNFSASSLLPMNETRQFKMHDLKSRRGTIAIGIQKWNKNQVIFSRTLLTMFKYHLPTLLEFHHGASLPFLSLWASLWLPWCLHQINKICQVFIIIPGRYCLKKKSDV